MANLNYTFIGVNTGQLASSVNMLRGSSVYRQIEEGAGNQGISNVVVVMGPNVTSKTTEGVERHIPAESGLAPNDPTTWYVFLDTTTVAMRDNGSGPRPLTVEQLIVHEMAHAIFPARILSWGEWADTKSPAKNIEESGVINLTDAVSAQMGMFDSTRGVIYRDNAGPESRYRGPGSIWPLEPDPVSPEVLRFKDGSPASTGIGLADGVPTVLGTIRGVKKLEVTGDTATEMGTSRETFSETENVSDGWQESVTPFALGVGSTFGTLGGFTGTVFDIANIQPWSSATVSWDLDGNVRTVQTSSHSLGGQLTQYDPNNTHPYDKLDITKGPDGKVAAAQVTLDPAVLQAGMSIGQIFGSAIGGALGGNSLVGNLAGSTIGGLIGQKFIQVLATSMTADLSRISLNDVFSSQGISVGNAGIGAVSSFLTAELGHALHIDGFSGQLFNTAVSGFTTSLLIQVKDVMVGGGLDFASAIAMIDWTQAVAGAIDVAQLNLGNLLGSYLGHELVPAQTREGAIGGQLFGAIGSFILPGGLGSLIGTILGTWIGNQFGTQPSPGAVDLLDQAGYLYGHSQYQSSDGGGYEISNKMALAAEGIINAYLHAVDGAALDHSKQATIGYIKNPDLLFIHGIPSRTDHSFVSADDAVHAAALDVLQNLEVIGGNLLMKRAHQNSPSNTPEAAPAGGGIPGRSQISGADQLATMAGDLSVAQDYENYLDNREAINALIAVYHARRRVSGAHPCARSRVRLQRHRMPRRSVAAAGREAVWPKRHASFR